MHWGGRALQRHVLGDCLHVAQDRRIENPRIVAGHLRIGVSEHFGDVFYGRSACKGQRGERVPRSMGRKEFANTAYIGQLFQINIHLLITAHRQQYTMRLTIGAVFSESIASRLCP